MSALLSELLAAHRRTRNPELAAALADFGLPALDVPIWGVAFVEPIGNHYMPRADGRPAVIVPVFNGSELVDLTATGIRTRRTVTRCGIAAVLGQDALDLAMESETAAFIFNDPIEWLQNCCRGAVILDWSVARFALADLPGIACTTELLAKRIKRELQQPAHVPPLFVKEGLHREAA